MTLSPVVFDKKVVRRTLNKYAGDMGDVLLDDKYYVLSNAEWNYVVKIIGAEADKYQSDRFDCDKFARVWYGKVAEKFEVNSMAIVVDYSGRHSYNALLVHDGAKNLNVVLFEPQNLSRPVKGTKPYVCKSGFFMF